MKGKQFRQFSTSLSREKILYKNFEPRPKTTMKKTCRYDEICLQLFDVLLLRPTKFVPTNKHPTIEFLQENNFIFMHAEKKPQDPNT